MENKAKEKKRKKIVRVNIYRIEPLSKMMMRMMKRSKMKRRMEEKKKKNE